MLSLDTAVIVLAGIVLFAAFVNGALGYGFSSLTVPIALLFYSNRILNPAVVLIEVAINFYVLIINLNGVRAVWRRVFPIVIGLLPGIAVGALVLTRPLPGVNRSEIDGKPMGLQRHGDHHFDRQLLAVYLLHGTQRPQSDLKHSGLPLILGDRSG